MMIFGFVLASVTGVFPGFSLWESMVGIILGIIGFIGTVKISKIDS
jgi:putative membrane protein